MKKAAIEQLLITVLGTVIGIGLVTAVFGGYLKFSLDT